MSLTKRVLISVNIISVCREQGNNYLFKKEDSVCVCVSVSVCSLIVKLDWVKFCTDKHFVSRRAISILGPLDFKFQIRKNIFNYKTKWQKKQSWFNTRCIKMWRLFLGNSYCNRKWTQLSEFKPWTRLFAFHITLIPLRNV